MLRINVNVRLHNPPEDSNVPPTYFFGHATADILKNLDFLELHITYKRNFAKERIARTSKTRLITRFIKHM